MTAAKILLIALTSLTASLGNSLLKKGSAAAAGSAAQPLSIKNLPGTFLRPLIICGVIVYGLSQLFWITALRVTDLSLLYPLQIGLNFTLIMLAAWLYFKEPVSVAKLAGVLLIFSGIVIMTAF